MKINGISFCIITQGIDDTNLKKAIASIVALNIPTYEVVFVGGDKTTVETSENIRWVPFDEGAKAHIEIAGKPGAWITRKKNVAVQNAKYDICVVIHDYLAFDPDWWIEFEKFGYRWDICVHQNIYFNGHRGDGWIIDRHPLLPRGTKVPWDMIDLVQYMGISGNYFCIKRECFLEEPMDENLLWGQGEEMEWSRRVVPKFHIRCNPKCIYRYVKDRPTDIGAIEHNARTTAYERVFAALRECRMENFVMYYEPGFNNNERTIQL
jgi:glycosyltransferase involved in cell wall biosynthesis